MSEFRLGGNKFGIFVYARDNFWFRVFGRGLSVAPLKDHKPLFSERHHVWTVWHKFGHCWRIL